MKLFEDDSSGEEGKADKIEINKDFARRFQYNKKREELQRYEELKKKGAISESDSDESEEEEEEDEDKFGKKKDLKFIDALLKIRNQDPILKDKEAKLFESESETEDEELGRDGGGGREKTKKLYLKDVNAKHLLEGGPEFEEEDGDVDVMVDKKVKSYSEEQEELKKAFLDEVAKLEEEGEDGREFLRVKSKADGNDYGDEDQEMARKVDEFFGGHEKLDEGTLFLKDYFKNRMWVGGGCGKGGELDEEGMDLMLSEDEEEIERQEEYERDYNFRFEENAGDRVMGHARIVEGSVRKKENKRKEQRERKKTREAQAEFEMKEEIKRLKNLKKKEMQEKIQKIREVAGIGDSGARLLDDLDEEFDPEEYDKKMREAFDEEYYEAEDINPQFGSDNDEDEGEIEKPDFDKEDELLGLPNGWDEVDKEKDELLDLPNDGGEASKAVGNFLAARQKVLKLKAQNGGDDEQKSGEGLEAEAALQKKVNEAVKNVSNQCLEEYYQLDCEDTIGDLKTRFKYRTVKPKKFGLTAKEILMADNKELNQVVPIKKLAPYGDMEWKPPRNKVIKLKQEIREMPKRESSDVAEAGKYFRGNGEKRKAVAKHENGKGPQLEEVNGDTGNQSRRTKRRQSQAELKLSRQRLFAYGKIHLKSKQKKKS